MHAFDDDTGRVTALRAAAQDHCVARFETQGAGVRADIGAGFVDHTDNANGHCDPLDREAIWTLERREVAANGVWQVGNLF